MNTFLKTYHKDLVNYFSENENHLSIAIRNINQINDLKIHDEDLKGNAGVEKLDVFNIVEEINSNFPELQILVQPYHHIVRNIKLCLS